MIRKIGQGDFRLTTDLNSGESFHSIIAERFYILKFRTKKIELAPKGCRVQIEHKWRNGRVKAECFSFEDFKERHIKNHSAIFFDGAETVSFFLGLNYAGTFIPIQEQKEDSLRVKTIRGSLTKIKDFKIQLFYDLYEA